MPLKQITCINMSIAKRHYKHRKQSYINYLRNIFFDTPWKLDRIVFMIQPLFEC